ncbi:MAG: hypothetical protein M3384_04275 [Acidobacteriota bacterium]|nr:hypothetical protein [Acidobacteriota bacterium]
MYCSACGSEVQEGLRYCNRCGANLAAAADEATGAPPRLFGIIMVLAGVIALVGVAGLVTIFFFSIELMSRGSVPAETVVFLIVFTLVVFGIVALLTRQLSRVLTAYLESGGATSRQTGEQKLNKAPHRQQQQQTRQQQPVGELTVAEEDFISAQTASLHQTAAQKSEQTTRVLQGGEEPATRRLAEDD